MSEIDLNCYGKRQIRRKDIISLKRLIEIFPEFPEDTEGKTYVLKLVNGELQFIEEEENNG